MVWRGLNLPVELHRVAFAGNRCRRGDEALDSWRRMHLNHLVIGFRETKRVLSPQNVLRRLHWCFDEAATVVLELIKEGDVRARKVRVHHGEKRGMSDRVRERHLLASDDIGGARF